MILAERHIIKNANPLYKELDKVCFLSKNLYNTTLYAIRQHYFEHKKHLNYYKIDNLFKTSNNPDYRALPIKVSQHTIKMVDKNFKSFFGLLKKKSQTPSIPRYLDKMGKYLTTFTNQAISKKELKNGYIKLSGCNGLIKTKVKNVNQVRLVPKFNYIIVEVLYGKNELLKKEDNKRYRAIDLGVNNLATISSNVIHPFIINGKPLKSINQYYNKVKSSITSELERVNKCKISDKLINLSLKRNNKISDYIHKSSRYIVNQLALNNINTLVIGYNEGWKQDINIGKVNNQKFVNIPFLKFVNQLKYKCQLVGIKVVMINESYTSKCSFLDNETIEKQIRYKGKRIKRGLFKSGSGHLINADVNGSLNILRKAFPNAFDAKGIEVCSTPRIWETKS